MLLAASLWGNAIGAAGGVLFLGRERPARCKVKDPSRQTWPALGEAILGNIIPDLPVGFGRRRLTTISSLAR
jgi:hypothetical protein